MEVNITFEGTTLVIYLIGELDEHSAEITRRKMDNAIQTNNFDKVTLDLSRLSFMDSTGIGVIIGRYKLLKQKNKQLLVRNCSTTIDKIFSMSGLYEIISKVR